MSRPSSLFSGWRTAWSGLDPDRRNSILLFSGISLLVLIALLVIGYGYYNNEIAYKNDTVLTVGNRTFSYSAIERRLEYELNRGNLTSVGSAQEAAVRAFALVENEEVLRQGAADLGIVLTEAEIDARIRGQIGVPQDASQDDMAGPYRRDVLDSGLSVQEYRDLAGVILLRDRVRAHFEETIPAETEHVDLLMILTRDSAKADEAKQRLDDGEAFADVAAAISVDASNSAGGSAGWRPTGSLSPLVNDAAFSLPIGQTSDVIATPEGDYYVIQARAREVRAVDDNGRTDIVDQSYQQWLQETRERIGSVTSLRTKHLSELSKRVLEIVTAGS